MKLRIDPGAAVLASLVYFFSDWSEITAAAAAIAVHELGHLAAIKAEGLAVNSFRAEISGLCISYRGSRGTAGDILAAAAGPAAGLLYALAASWAYTESGNEWLVLSAGISLVLSLFNLLPVMPLDGGRIMMEILTAAFGEMLGERIACAISTVCAAAFFAWGAWLLYRQNEIAVYAAGACLLILQIKRLKA